MIYIDKDKINELKKYGFIGIKNDSEIKKYVLFSDKVLSGVYEAIITIMHVPEDQYWVKIHKYDDKTMALIFELIINKVINKVGDKNIVDIITERKKQKEEFIFES